MLRIPGYEITYPRDGSMALAMAEQLPRILSAVISENRWLKRVATRRHFDLVISDNRFGLSHPRIPSVYITHQPSIRLPVAVRSLEPTLRAFHIRIMKRFTEVWIPDWAEEPSFAGELTHPPRLPHNFHYIGPITRFGRWDPSRKLEPGKGESGREEMTWDLCAIVSGPEPQRTILEEMVIRQLRGAEIKAVVLAGRTEDAERVEISPKVELFSHLPSGQIEQIILRSRVILSRPGYSTPLDMAALGKKAIFIPTPGQTEQEYLAGRLKTLGGFVIQRQDKFDLLKALKEAEASSASFPSSGVAESLDDRLDALLPGQLQPVGSSQ